MSQLLENLTQKSGSSDEIESSQIDNLSHFEYTPSDLILYALGGEFANIS